jgi:type VI secretion system protein
LQDSSLSQYRQAVDERELKMSDDSSIFALGSDAIMSAIKSGMSFQRSKVWLERVSFRASEDMNNSSPVTIHVVVVYNPDLLKSIASMDAYAYFQKSDQLKIDNAGQIDIFSFDLIRGQRLNNQEINPTKSSGEGVIIFARYTSPGPHRAALSDESAVLVELGKDDFRVTPIKS